MLALTAVAGWLGPQLSGLLAPFPIIASVLATFTHTQRGVDEALRLLRGLLSGFAAFALFCFTLALALPALDVAAAFALATGIAVLRAGPGAAADAARARRRVDPRAGPLPVGRRAEGSAQAVGLEELLGDARRGLLVDRDGGVHLLDRGDREQRS